MLGQRPQILGFLICLAWLWPALAESQDTRTAPPATTQARGDADGQKASEAAQGTSLERRNRRYQLHSADVLELTFPYTPDFNQTVTVQPDGYITLKGLEGVKVEGLSIPEVSKSLETAYATILHDPVINIALKDFEKPSFIVGGEVGHPGKFDLRDDTSVAQAVAIAGGMKDSAKNSDVLLFHRVPDGWVQSKRINLKKMMHDGDENEDAHLQPGDFIFVPKSNFSKIERFIPTSSMGMYASPMIH